MSKVLLTNHDVHDDVLAYETDTGAMSRHPRADLPLGKETDRGFFAQVDADVYGVFAAATGPIFFKNAERIPLVRGEHGVSLRKGSRSHRFALTRGGEELVAVWYRAPQIIAGTNAYDDEPSFNDFFAWVAANIDSERFYTWHTVARKKAGGFGEYLWVRNRTNGQFVERYRVIMAGEDGDALPDRGELDGVVLGAEANNFFQGLVDRFARETFECGRTYATDWKTIEKQVVALRDYDYD